MELVLSWKKGKTMNYTQNLYLAEIALKNGCVVYLQRKDSF